MEYKDLSREDTSSIVDAEALFQYIQNVLGIYKGEIPFKRNFGCNIEEYLFEPYSFINLKFIESEVRRAIANDIPFVSLEDINGEFNHENGEYKIHITVRVPFTDKVLTTSVDYKLEE